MVATEEVSVNEAARRAVLAAEEANKAVEADPNVPQAVRVLTARVLRETQTVLTTAAASPRRRQSFAEFTTMLSEEVKEAAEDTMAEGMVYAERSWRKAKSAIEDHFLVDEAFRMLGPLRQDSNLARDVHDWFNLVALIPVVALNAINWKCFSDEPFCGMFSSGGILKLWHGQAFFTFWWTSFAYFIVDMLFVLLLPQCVKSPAVIIKHHVATIAYIMVPKLKTQTRWLMGACLIVELNTWFLIARRYFNRNGDKMFTPGVPLLKSLRLALISTCFYVSWFVIRLGLYPWLFFVIMGVWYDESVLVGTPVNLLAITPVMHTIFIFLNVKWTVDLIRSKLKGRGPAKGL